MKIRPFTWIFFFVVHTLARTYLYTHAHIFGEEEPAIPLPPQGKKPQAQKPGAASATPTKVCQAKTSFQQAAQEIIRRRSSATAPPKEFFEDKGKPVEKTDVTVVGVTSEAGDRL